MISLGEMIVSNIITLPFSFVGVILGILYRNLSKKVKQQENVKDGIITILHHTLYDECMYHIKRGYLADEHELKEIEYIYTAYSRLGGNGTGTELYERCKRLEIREETT